MAFTLNNSFRFYRVTGDAGSEVYTPFGHAQDNSFEMSADEIDVSSKDTPRGQSETIAGTINSTANVTGYIFEGDAIGIKEILQAIQGRETWDVIMTNNDQGVTDAVTIRGSFLWLSGAVGSPDNAGVSDYSASGKFTGNVVVGPTS